MANKILSGTLLDERTLLSLEEISEACAVRAEWIIDLVAEGIIEPSGTEFAEWAFSGASISRVRIARRLQNDLEINLAGVALAIELLEELETMRARLRSQETRSR